MNVSGVAHLTKDITIDQFNNVVTNIIIGSFLGFSDDELSSEGKAYNRAYTFQ